MENFRDCYKCPCWECSRECLNMTRKEWLFEELWYEARKEFIGEAFSRFMKPKRALERWDALNPKPEIKRDDFLVNLHRRVAALEAALAEKGISLCPPLITTFCLGCCAGMIYTFAVYQIVEHKHKRKDNEKV